MATATATLTSTATRSHPVRRTALAYGAVAAVATTGVAAAAHAAGVPLEVDGQMIPFAGFAQMVLLGAVLGGLLAAALNRYSSDAYRWFVRTAVALTALSCVPSVALPHDAATKIVLVTTHAFAALIIVPALARQTR
jgi:MFS family permease